MRILLPFLLATGSLVAAEEIVLTTGFRLQADRHEDLGATVLVHTAQGSMEFARALVERIDLLEAAAKPAPPVAVQPDPPRPAPATPKELLTSTAERLGLPAAFLHSVAKVESAYRPEAVSPKGAIGIMQLMPATAQRLQVDPRDTVQNIEGGARLLRELLEKYQDQPDQVRRALSAYNAGAGAVQRYNGTPPYAETRNYVEKVLNEYSRLRGQPAK